MKLLVALCVLAFVGLSSTASRSASRGCIYIEGRCARMCEKGTHSYTTGCGQKTPEPTCKEPNPQKERGNLCDYSACYCDAPTVRDTDSGKCVPLEKCPK